MEEKTTRPNKLPIKRCYTPNRLSEETLIGIYDRVLQVAAAQHDKEQPPEPSVPSLSEHATMTGGRS